MNKHTRIRAAKEGLRTLTTRLISVSPLTVVAKDLKPRFTLVRGGVWEQHLAECSKYMYPSDDICGYFTHQELPQIGLTTCLIVAKMDNYEKLQELKGLFRIILDSKYDKLYFDAQLELEERMDSLHAKLCVVNNRTIRAMTIDQYLAFVQSSGDNSIEYLSESVYYLMLRLIATWSTHAIGASLKPVDLYKVVISIMGGW